MPCRSVAIIKIDTSHKTGWTWVQNIFENIKIEENIFFTMPIKKTCWLKIVEFQFAHINQIMKKHKNSITILLQARFFARECASFLSSPAGIINIEWKHFSSMIKTYWTESGSFSAPRKCLAPENAVSESVCTNPHQGCVEVGNQNRFLEGILMKAGNKFFSFSRSFACSGAVDM